jgi:hypothetical protein
MALMRKSRPGESNGDDTLDEKSWSWNVIAVQQYGGEMVQKKKDTEGKRIELYTTCLELDYCVHDADDRVSDLQVELKDIKARRRKLIRMRKNAEELYEQHYAMKPNYKKGR